jgi:hypothetical protein
MSLRHRVRRVEGQVGLVNHGKVPIIWDGKMVDMWRERAEMARRRKAGINVILFGYETCADSMEDARALVAEHRETAGFARLVVHRRGDRDKVLMTYEPELPDWLTCFEDDGET